MNMCFQIYPYVLLVNLTIVCNYISNLFRLISHALYKHFSYLFYGITNESFGICGQIRFHFKIKLNILKTLIILIILKVP